MSQDWKFRLPPCLCCSAWQQRKLAVTLVDIVLQSVKLWRMDLNCYGSITSTVLKSAQFCMGLYIGKERLCFKIKQSLFSTHCYYALLKLLWKPDGTTVLSFYIVTRHFMYVNHLIAKRCTVEYLFHFNLVISDKDSLWL